MSVARTMLSDEIPKSAQVEKTTVNVRTNKQLRLHMCCSWPALERQALSSFQIRTPTQRHTSRRQLNRKGIAPLGPTHSTHESQIVPVWMATMWLPHAIITAVHSKLSSKVSRRPDRTGCA